MMPPAKSEMMVHRWLVYALEDLAVARHILKFTHFLPARSIAFHAQQSIEKNLKAFLLFKKVEAPYTHNIGNLLELCKDYADWVESVEDVDELTYFAVSGRYPDIEEDVISLEEAKNYIQMAERVEQVVHTALKAEGQAMPDIQFE